MVPGETALAFYSATNLTDRPITGISTYNVIPFSAGQYFHKVQCFCFEEQRLNPHEQVLSTLSMFENKQLKYQIIRLMSGLHNHLFYY